LQVELKVRKAGVDPRPEARYKEFVNKVLRIPEDETAETDCLLRSLLDLDAAEVDDLHKAIVSRKSALGTVNILIERITGCLLRAQSGQDKAKNHNQAVRLIMLSPRRGIAN